ncbi:NAD-dependent protein deacetylase Sirt2-like [Eurosta solidaginis]|uniref:NAD-dependent protein deacetylase Sirt2-like n=1 Tax=Eurosta solidaginis TaxID=178769 RepID=UPI00353099AB
MENPRPFLKFAKEMYPGSFTPTTTHYFIRLLHEKNLLIRHYTQNIDALERLAGIPEDKLLEVHGNLLTNHCLECRKSYTKDWMKEKIFSDELPVCDDCGSLVKPDIIFYGEKLTERFYELPEQDFKKCDLLIIMGTSLAVNPFASLIDKVHPNCFRLLINKNPIEKFNVQSEDNVRDVEFIGNCDDGIWQIAEALHWANELRELIDSENADQNKKKLPIKTPEHKPDDEGSKRKTRSITAPRDSKRRS